MKNIFCCLFIIVLIDGIKAQCPKFIYNYDAAGNRTQREYVAVCENARMAKDSLLTDSLFIVAQQEIIELPETTTEILSNETDQYGFVIAELKNVYPNPTKGNFVVQFSAYIKNSRLDLLDTKGVLLHTQQLYGSEFQIDISLLSSGTYILNIRLEDGKTYSKKVVKI